MARTLRSHVSRGGFLITALGSVAASVILAAVVAPGTSTAWQPARAGRSAEAIVITDQAEGRILVLASDAASWETATVLWRWHPSEANGLGEFIDKWGSPDEAKLRHRGEQAYLLTTDSLGLAAVVPYPQGRDAHWAADVGRSSNPHSIELLPDGNVAVVASHGNWLRIYTASQGSRSTDYTEYTLHDAHGVYWDAKRELLWALGGEDLVALRLGGTPAAPSLAEARRAALPTPGGHDLQPVGGDAERLWVTSNTQVYQYSIARDVFLQDFPDARLISRANVKSVGDDPVSGQVLTAFVQEGNPCAWCTNTVTLYNDLERFTLQGAQIYKARWWVDPNAQCPMPNAQ